MNKEVRFQKDELLRKSAFSADDFAAVGLPGLPGTARAWRDLLKTTDWPHRTVRSRGRGGLKHEYEPPVELLEVIRRHLRGEEVTKDEVAAARAVRVASHRAQRGVPMAQMPTQGAEGEEGMREAQKQGGPSREPEGVSYGLPGMTAEEQAQLIEASEKRFSRNLAARAQRIREDAERQAAQARSERKAAASVDEQLLLLVGFASYEADWLPAELPTSRRAALVNAATRAICAITASNPERAKLAETPGALDAALRLAWFDDVARSEGAQS